MGDSPAGDPRPGDWIVWERPTFSPRTGHVTRVYLGRVAGHMVIKRGRGFEREAIRVAPTTGDLPRVFLPPQLITTIIRTGEAGEMQTILDLLQHDQPDIRSMALQVIAEHTGERWSPPVGWGHTSVCDSLGGWRRSDDDE